MHRVDGLIENVTMFLKGTIQSWLCSQFHPPESQDEIQQQIILFNSNILIEGKLIFWKSVFHHGVWFINDTVCLCEDGETYEV